MCSCNDGKTFGVNNEGGGVEANEDVEGEEQEDEAVLLCMIFLDAVATGGEERSIATLQCGHEFHLGEQLHYLGILGSFLHMS
jgi:hypothetical protein